MSQAYLDYLKEHVNNVGHALWWMIDHHIIEDKDGTLIQDFIDAVPEHDLSKYGSEEFDAYDDYFYGKEGLDDDDISVVDSAFDYAWLHHIHCNPHHWQYWVLMEDEGKVKPLQMPSRYIYEMIADWWSFSFRSGNLYEIFDWYDDHENKMTLHEDTKHQVELILARIRYELDSEKAEKENENGENHDAGNGAG
jgi:hypothetical protein